MHPILQKLSQEHRRMWKLLNLLQEELDKLDTGAEVNPELMRDIVDYTANYTDIFHHPKEDAIYGKMLAHDEECRAAVDLRDGLRIERDRDERVLVRIRDRRGAVGHARPEVGVAGGAVHTRHEVRSAADEVEDGVGLDALDALEADAEEAVQEIFLELWEKAARFDPAVAGEVTFVSMIARRRLIDRRRKLDNEPIAEALDRAKSTQK